MAYMEASEGPSTHIVPELDEDIIFNIFTFLPAGKICDLRYQCWRWFHMISSSSFIRTHLQRSQPGLLFVQRQFFGSSLISKPVNHKTTNQKITLRKFSAGAGTRVWDTCNGLVLYGDRYNIRETFLANPVTRDVLQLPCPPGYVIESILSKSFQHLLGLVYMDSTRAYKVIHCVKSIFTEYSTVCCCDVLTLGDECSWKRLSIPFQVMGWDIIELPTIVFVNGVAHWIASEIFGHRRIIISLDLTEEKFYKTEFPKSARYKEELIEIKGSLCCICRISSRRVNYYQIWAMHDLNKGEWVKLQRITLEPLHTADFSPCTSLGNDNVIVFIQCVAGAGYKYVAYDLHSKRKRSFYREKNACDQVFPCSETLVSPRNFIPESHC